MSHVRAIAEVPTSDDPTGTNLDNPFSTAGRPVYETKINSITMIGVADPDGELSMQTSSQETGSSTGTTVVFVGLFVVVALGIGYVVVKNNSKEEAAIYEAELLEENDTSKTT